MVDLIKFSTAPARVMRTLLEQVEYHPLYQKRTVTHSRSAKSKLTAVQFGQSDHRWVTIKILSGHEGSPRLCGLDVNLPSVLKGHNGRLVKTPYDMVLGLTWARHLVATLVHPDDVRLILPGRDKDNGGFIRSVECPVQLQDPNNELLLAAHLTACRNFQKPPILVPGEYVCHRSSGLDLKFYDKVKESAEGFALPTEAGCTRIEAAFRTGRRLGEALGLGTSKEHSIATITFADLYFAFRQVIQNSLIGALADAAGSRSENLRPATRSILALAGDATSLFAALAEQQKILSPREFSKIRRQVYHQLARIHPVSLPALIESWPTGMLSEIGIPHIEFAHQRTAAVLGWPETPDIDIAQAFSGLLLRRKDNPALSLWLGPDDQPF